MVKNERRTTNDERQNVAIVILAGGRGARFWPASRRKNPKQFLRLLSDRSLFQETVRRVLLRFDYSQIYVVAPQALRDKIRKEVPELQEDNYILEPDTRSTAACIGLAAFHLKAQKGDDFEELVMVVLSSDHLILDEELFHSQLQVAINTAKSTKYLVTLGIMPTRPEIGYGYIEVGPLLKRENDHDVNEVVRFVEKPSRTMAQEFMESKKFLWNSGMFIWKGTRIIEAIKEFLPKTYEVVKDYGDPKLLARDRDRLDKKYRALEKIPIESGVMEVDKFVAVVPMDIVWDDLGDWASLGRAKLGLKRDGNVVMSKRRLIMDSQGMIIHAPKKLVTTLGVNDVIVVDMDDVLLICTKDRVQEVKKLVQKLEEKNLEEYL